MCLNPLKIYNKSYLRLGGPKFLEVPCGKCPECSNVKQLDMFLRVYATYKDLVLNNNWSCWFCTFTFNDDNLPKSRICYAIYDTINNGKLQAIDYNTKSSKYVDIYNLDYRYSYYRKFGHTLYGRSDNYISCFDHRIMQRFIKSFRQYYRRQDLPEPQMLVTSEFGSKSGRPHYHGIVFVPKYFNTWIEFQQEINKFWHYGFTYNHELSVIDKVTTKRSVTTAIKYTLKYITKNDMVLPEYLNHKDECILYDIPKEYYTPRTFTTNGFGSALEKLLTPSDYKNNKITLAVPDSQNSFKYKTFNIPAYNRRRYFQTSQVLFSEIYNKDTFWMKQKKFYKKEQIVHYKNDYLSVRRCNFENKFKNEFQRSTLIINSKLTEDEFVKFKFWLIEYDKPSFSNICHYSVKFLPDPIKSDDYRYLDTLNKFYDGIIKKIPCLNAFSKDSTFKDLSLVFDSKSLYELYTIYRKFKDDNLKLRKDKFNFKPLADDYYFRTHEVLEFE